MGTLLKMDNERLTEGLKGLKEAIEVFRPYAEGGFQEEIGLVEGMQSDFTLALKAILESREKDGKRVLGGMEEYCRLSGAIVEVLKRETDEAMARQMEVKTDG